MNIQKTRWVVTKDSLGGYRYSVGGKYGGTDDVTKAKLYKSERTATFARDRYKHKPENWNVKKVKVTYEYEE